MRGLEQTRRVAPRSRPDRVQGAGRGTGPIALEDLRLLDAAGSARIALDLQRAAGNQATAQILYRSPEDEQNSYVRVAGDITAAFESGGKVGKLQTADRGIISYGRHQATLAGGNLYTLLDAYVAASSTPVAAQIRGYLTRVKAKDASLADDRSFLDLLRSAASDPQMALAQDKIFRRQYWDPATRHAQKAGVKSALGYALLYDNTVQGGSGGTKSRLARVEKALGGKIGETVSGKVITEQAFLRAFVEDRISSALRQSVRDQARGQTKLEEAAAKEQAALSAPADQAKTLRAEASRLRKEGQRMVSNGKAMKISAEKTRGPTWRTLVESGDLDLRGDANGKVLLAGKNQKITGLREGATIDGTAPGAAVPGQPAPAPTKSVPAAPVPATGAATDREPVTDASTSPELPAHLLDRARSLGAALGPPFIRLAISFGARDANSLTNVAFWARHPDRWGDKIGARETGLAQEWLQLRDSLVRPALDTTRTVPTPKASPPRGQDKSSSARPKSSPGAVVTDGGGAAPAAVNMTGGTNRAYTLDWDRAAADFNIDAGDTTLRQAFEPEVDRQVRLSTGGEFGDWASAVAAMQAAATADAARHELLRRRLWQARQYALVETLNVSKSTRYLDTKKDGKLSTYCNIYAHDMVTAMGAYLPRVWWTSAAAAALLAGKKVKPVYDKTIHELSANLLVDWMNKWGTGFGWSRTNSVDAAQEAANSGQVVIILAANINPKRSGHVNVILAESAQHRATSKGGKRVSPLQSQAGASNWSYSDSAGKVGRWWETHRKDLVVNPETGEKTEAGQFFTHSGSVQEGVLPRPDAPVPG